MTAEQLLNLEILAGDVWRATERRFMRGDKVGTQDTFALVLAVKAWINEARD
ncbi:MAG TPA: hypothetical protein VMA98_01330 [Candidatus Acidoferrales bacterium]|nr:hypothetical protein [Candidatus Acidoferrales bacterium]